MWVLPTPLGPSSTTFSARGTNARWASSWICAFGAPPAWLQSNCSSVLIDGIVASRVSVIRLRSSRMPRSLVSTRFQEVGEAGFVACGVLRQRRPFGAQAIELQLLAQGHDPIVLLVHANTSSSSS